MADDKALVVKESAPLRALSPFDQMDRMFDRLLARRGWLHPWRSEWPAAFDLDGSEARVPRVDVLDREDDLQVRIEVPGVDKKDIDVSVGEDSLTVKGELDREEKEEAGDYVRCEISRGAFSRTIGLPAAVDGSRAKAQFRDGLLTLTLPKVERAKRHSVHIE
jgi:HSP20 family protein